MAELAYFFSWAPDTLNRLDLTELVMWREEAVRIHNHLNAQED